MHECVNVNIRFFFLLEVHSVFKVGSLGIYMIGQCWLTINHSLWIGIAPEEQV